MNSINFLFHIPPALSLSISFLDNGATPNGSHALRRSQSLQTPQIAATSSSVPIQSQYHPLQQQQKFHLNNYTNHLNASNTKPNDDHRPPPVKISRLNSLPATSTITSEQQVQQKQLPAPLNFPIQISYVGDAGVIESPAVKIDYSKFTLPATSPSIKIDLTSFNQPEAKPSSGLDEDYDI